MAGPPPIIGLRGIRKAFGEKRVLDGVDLDLFPGETHVVLGRSGTGKSVLLKILCGLMTPDEGAYTLDGEAVDFYRAADRARVRGSIQMLFQGGAMFDSMSVADNIAFHALEHGELKRSDVPDFAREYLEMVDLADSGPLAPSELSGGMRKRAALARALASRPRIMLYDEPTTGLDPLTGQVINQLIRETQRRIGVTSIVVTHDLRSAQEVGDRCSFLVDGRILETTTPRDLAGSQHDLIRAFVANATIAT